ncbi:MAG: fatty acid desaturase, partial [Bacteroidia bacterium]|nr:fatty acid desaturase [Bacteroidia bacterium]
MGIKGSVKFVNKNRSVFFSTLRANVETYFAEKNISKHADARMITKTVVLLCGYLLPYAAILLFHLPTALLLLLFAIMGFSMAGIGMSIMHDANHGAYSHKKNINKLMSYSLNMLGNTSFNWKFQHNVLHHTYTNIHNMDDDLEGPSAVRFSPHQPLKRIHKYQHIYVFVFYSLLTVNWVVLKDFVQLIRYRKNGVNNVNRKEHIRNIFVLILSKLFYFFYIL